jgi:hypothetical protein
VTHKGSALLIREISAIQRDSPLLTDEELLCHTNRANYKFVVSIKPTLVVATSNFVRVPKQSPRSFRGCSYPFAVAGTKQVALLPGLRPCAVRQTLWTLNGPALGAVASEAAIRDTVLAGGFTQFRRATETPFNRIFEARK